MVIRVALAVAISLGAGFSSVAAQDQGQSSRPRVIVNPDWAGLPTAADLSKHYPPEASRQGLGGRAVLRCTVTETGGLEGCSVAEETPQGAGFGAAALAMTPLFRMKPRTKDRAPVSGASVVVPIRFQLPQPAK